MNWIKKYRVDIALIIVSVIVTIIIIDVVLYFTHYRYAITRLDYPRFYFVKDSELGFDISPNFATTTHYFADAAFPVWSNNLGCFDTNYAGETPYIYMTGDSLTWGFSPFNDTWGKMVQDLIGIRTVKCGITGGYGTKQELIRTSRALEHLPTPSVIIVGYTPANDVNDDANFPDNTVYNGYLVPNLTRGEVTEMQAEQKYALFDTFCTIEFPSHILLQKIRCMLSNHSVLYNLFRKNIRDRLTSIFSQSMLEKNGVIVPNIASPDRNSDLEYQKHLDNIMGFKILAEKKGSKLLFLLGNGDNTKLISFLEKEDITYLDLDPIFKKYSKVKPLIWKIDGHWNITGNYLVGLKVSKYLIENDLVKVVDKRTKTVEIDAFIKHEFND